MPQKLNSPNIPTDTRNLQSGDEAGTDCDLELISVDDTKLVTRFTSYAEIAAALEAIPVPSLPQATRWGMGHDHQALIMTLALQQEQQQTSWSRVQPQQAKQEQNDSLNPGRSCKTYDRLPEFPTMKQLRGAVIVPPAWVACQHAAEYALASELCRRDIPAHLMAGLRPEQHILALSPDACRSAVLQVRAASTQMWLIQPEDVMQAQASCQLWVLVWMPLNPEAPRNVRRYSIAQEQAQQSEATPLGTMRYFILTAQEMAKICQDSSQPDQDFQVRFLQVALHENQWGKISQVLQM